MKLIIFTLDSIFALIIAVSAIALLSLFFFAPQTSTVLSYSSGASTLQNFLTASAGALVPSGAIYQNISYQANATNEVWDQFLKDQYFNGGNVHGPRSPAIAFNYTAPSSSTTVSRAAVDFGRMYFIIGNILYSINATTGNFLWSKNIVGTEASSPIIAQGKLIYANRTNLTAINPITNTIIWSSNAPIAFSQPIAYGNKIYAILGLPSTNVVAAYYVSNGTQAWSYTVPAGGGNGGYIAIDGGSLAVVTSGSTSTITLLQDFGSSANVIWTNSGIAQAVYGLATSRANNLIAYMSPSAANALYINGTQASGFPFTVTSQSFGYPNIYNNIIYYQTSNALTAIAINGVQLWTYTVPSRFGSAVSAPSPQPGQSSIALVSSTDVYTAWSNGYLLATNTLTGNADWSTNTPTGGALYLDALAYGRLYTTFVPSSGNDKIIVYGSCNSGGGQSVLQIIANLYANGQGSCADALVNSAATTSNYSIFLNNTFAPSLSIASFNSAKNSKIQMGSSLSFDRTNPITLSFWLKASASGSDQFLVSDADGLSGTSAGFTVWLWHGANVVQWRLEDTSGNAYTVSGATNVEDGNWHLVTVTYDGLGDRKGMKIYVDGKLDAVGASSVISASINPSATQYLAQLAIGGANFGGTYFTGSISNLQVYNTSLSNVQVGQIYQSGLQSGPIKGAGLYGWYPLAGDSNDYSGFGVSGYNVNVIYSPSNYLPNGYLNSYQVSKSSVILPVTNYTTGLSKAYKVSVVSWR